MSTPLVKGILDSITGMIEDAADHVFPPIALRHPVQVEKIVLRKIDREGTYVFLNEIYVCNVIALLMNPADLEYTRTFPKTFREELMRSIREHIRANYGHAKNQEDVIELKIIEDVEVPQGRVDVELLFEECKSGVRS